MSETDPHFCQHLDAEGDPHYRYCVGLRLSHPTKDLSGLTSALGLKPAVIDRAGEPRIRHGRQYGLAKASFWVHDILAPTDHRSFEDFLTDISASLADKADVFRRHVAEGGDAELFIGFFLERSSTGFTLSHQLQRSFAALNLDLLCCIYNYDVQEEQPSNESPSTLQEADQPRVTP